MNDLKAGAGDGPFHPDSKMKTGEDCFEDTFIQAAFFQLKSLLSVAQMPRTEIEGNAEV